MNFPFHDNKVHRNSFCGRYQTWFINRFLLSAVPWMDIREGVHWHKYQIFLQSGSFGLFRKLTFWATLWSVIILTSRDSGDKGPQVILVIKSSLQFLQFMAVLLGIPLCPLLQCSHFGLRLISGTLGTLRLIVVKKLLALNICIQWIFKNSTFHMGFNVMPK